MQMRGRGYANACKFMQISPPPLSPAPFFAAPGERGGGIASLSPRGSDRIIFLPARSRDGSGVEGRGNGVKIRDLSSQGLDRPFSSSRAVSSSSSSSSPSSSRAVSSSPKLPRRRLAPLSALVISGDGPPSRFPSSPPPPSPAPRAARPREAYTSSSSPSPPPRFVWPGIPPGPARRGCVRASRRRGQTPSWDQREGAGTPTPVHPSPLSPGGGT